MSYIDRSANALARHIHYNYPEGASEAVLRYSLVLLINTLLAILYTLIICLFTGHVKEAASVIILYLSLRYFGGGSHMPTSLSCNIVSTIKFIILAHITFEYYYFGLIINIIALLIIAKNAPSGLDKMSRIDPRYYPYLKWIIIGIVSVNFVIQSSLWASCCLMQALFTTKISYKVSEYLGRRSSAV